MTEAGFERRTLAVPAQLTRSAAGGLSVRGYASTTASPYSMGSYTETVAPGAFTATLSRRPAVHLLVAHEGLPLASTSIPYGLGSLQLAEDARGLRFEAELDPQDPDSQRIVRKIDMGLVGECSFAFRVTRQEWDEDYTVRTICEVDLDRGDVSICPRGANPNTPVVTGAQQLAATRLLNAIRGPRRSQLSVDLALARAFALRHRNGPR